MRLGVLPPVRLGVLMPGRLEVLFPLYFQPEASAARLAHEGQRQAKEPLVARQKVFLARKAEWEPPPACQDGEQGDSLPVSLED